MATLIRLVAFLCVIGLGVGGYYWYSHADAGAAPVYRTAAIKRGDLLATISATGTVEPEEVVDVGAQVAGQINSFGVDANGKQVDYGSLVTEGMTLAQIDQSLFNSDVATARAQLAQAVATKARAEADLIQFQAKLTQAQADWERAQKLGPSKALAASSYDAFKAGFDVAKANIVVAQATIEQGKASIESAQATLDRAKRNLDYTTIRSPVKGVIIARRVNIGQTVVSSLSAPSLFLIAKDLTKIQVWASVNEADIGSIQPGQRATFTVDTFPGRTFTGLVNKVRLNATTTQNVVTYTVEISTDNADGKLLPYLTANVHFEIANHEGVLLVPNVALLWSPSPQGILPGAQVGSGHKTRGGAGGDTTGEPAAAKPKEAGKNGGAHHRGTLWVIEGRYVKPIAVKVGLTDGTNTEVTAVTADELGEDTAVVLGEQRADAVDTGGGTNPFLPQFPGKGKR